MKKITWSVSSLIVIILFLCIPFQKAIIIEEGFTEQMQLAVPIRSSQFTIEYTHSIHHSNIKEEYQILDDNMIRLTEIIYEDTAIGMPSHAEADEEFEMRDGKYYITNMKRDLEKLPMRTAQVVGTHKLKIGNEYLDLADVVTPGSYIVIKVKRVSLGQLWRGVKRNGLST